MVSGNKNIKGTKKIGNPVVYEEKRLLNNGQQKKSIKEHKVGTKKRILDHQSRRKIVSSAKKIKTSINNNTGNFLLINLNVFPLFKTNVFEVCKFEFFSMELNIN